MNGFINISNGFSLSDIQDLKSLADDIYINGVPPATLNRKKILGVPKPLNTDMEIIYNMDVFYETPPVRVWCYTMATDSIYGTLYDIGTDDEVTEIKLHHLYEVLEGNPDLGNESYHRLYYVKGFPIDVYKLQAAIRNFDPTTQVVQSGGEALTFKGDIVTIKERG